MKRLFDLFFSALVLLLALPAGLLIAVLVVADSPGGVFYGQIRVGRKGRDFKLLKFRTMRTGSDKKGLLTIGGRDSRVTRTGYYLRRYKLDELPQLINILKGDMSIVGPRPEVRKYVNMYNPEQLRVLEVRPGLTDYASLAYINENDLLSASDNPEQLYISTIMPDKLRLNLKYIEQAGLITDLKIIFRTLAKIVH